MAAYATQGFNLDDSGRRMVVDPIPPDAGMDVMVVDPPPPDAGRTDVPSIRDVMVVDPPPPKKLP